MVNVTGFVSHGDMIVFRTLIKVQKDNGKLHKILILTLNSKLLLNNIFLHDKKRINNQIYNCDKKLHFLIDKKKKRILYIQSRGNSICFVFV